MERSKAIQRINSKRVLHNARNDAGDHTNPQPRRRVWPGLVAVSTLLVGVATVLLHLLGMVVHRTYLAQWDIESALFPKSTDWLLLNGYYGVWNGFAMLFTNMVNNFHWLAVGVIALVIYIRLLTSAWNPFAFAGESMAWLQRLPNWLRRVGFWISIGTLIAALLVPLTLVLFLLIGVPANTGKLIGEAIFKSHLKEVTKGCSASKLRCIQVIKSDMPIRTGFVLDVSTTHLAYFDTDLNRARAIPIEGLEMRALLAPAAHHGLNK